MIDIAESGAPHPGALKNVREARHLDVDDVVRDVGISTEALLAIEDGEEPASRAVLKRLAKHYAVPLYFFYIDDLELTKTTLPDFRSRAPKVAKLGGALAASVTRAYEIRDVLSEGIEKVEDVFKVRGALPSLNVEMSIKSAARRLRSYFRLEQRPAQTFETTKVYLDWIRARAEYAGIITVFETLDAEDGRGYCIAHDNQIPYVVVNTTNNIGQEPRIFTLMHELVHVALHKSGVSDPFATRNEVERFCNRVAAEVLMPEDAFLAAAARLATVRSNNEFVRSLADAFKVSQQASALRAELTGAKPEGFYQRWMSQFTENVFSQYNFPVEKQIRISKDIGKRKIAKYGTTLPILLFELFEHRFIGALDIRRISGIKPKYLAATYGAATKRLKELGLDGE